jgi:hypothetical protein
MRRERIIAVVASAVAVVAFAAPTALAATPQQIGQDLADGRLDGTYTKQEMSDYLRSAAQQGYASPISQSAAPAGEQAQLGASNESGGTLAFTGVDLGLLTVGGLFLLALGVVLRLASRDRVGRKLT